MQDDKKQSSHIIHKYVPAALLVILFYFLIDRFTGFLSIVSAFMDILQPVFLGLAIAFLANPIMMFFERLLSRFLIRENKKPFIETVQYLINHLYEKIVGVIDWADELTGYAFADVMEAARTDGRIYVWIDTAEKWIRDYLNLTEDNLASTLTEYSLHFGRIIVNVLIGIFIAIYMLISKETFRGHSKRFVAAAFRPDIAEFILDVSLRGNQIFYGFIIGKIIDSIIIGIICWIGMTILGLNYSMLCSFIALLLHRRRDQRDPGLRPLHRRAADRHPAVRHGSAPGHHFPDLHPRAPAGRRQPHRPEDPGRLDRYLPVLGHLRDRCRRRPLRLFRDAARRSHDRASPLHSGPDHDPPLQGKKSAGETGRLRVKVQHPSKASGLQDEALAFRTKTTCFRGAGKARSASDRHMKQPLKRLRMVH